MPNQPLLYILDNEASAEFKKSLKKYGVEYQLVPPHVHRRNAAERAIQTFKNHFLAFLATCDPDFPVSEWDRLLFQAELTLNLLRSSRVNPKLSAYAYLNGNFDFNKTPLAPPGTKVLVHLKPDQRASWAYHGEEGWYVGPSMEHYRLTLNLLRSSRVNPKLSAYAYLNGNFDFNKTPLAPPGTKVLVHLKPDQRASWAYHGEEGWYVGPSMEHYRCVKCYLPSTAIERDVDTLQFFPNKIPFPNILTEDYLKQAASDILTVLQNPPSNLPCLAYGDATNNAIDVQLATLLGRAVAPPAPPNLPVFSPRVPIQSHQLPRVQPLSIAPPTAPIPLLPPMKILMLSPLIPKHKPVFPRVQPFQPSTHARLQQRRALNNPMPLQPSLQHIQAIQTFKHNVNHIYNEQGKKETLDTLLNGKDSAIWMNSLANEFGRLAQGCLANSILGTDTIDFIHRHEVPSNKQVTYGNFICDHRPLKTETHRVRCTAGGDKLTYDGDSGSPAASLLETKLIVNSTISDAHKGSKFLCAADLKDHFLASPMKDPEFMRIKYKYFPGSIRKQYNLDQFVASDDYI
jgi:hypothetical protein